MAHVDIAGQAAPPPAVIQADQGACIWLRASRVLPRSLCLRARAGVLHVSAHTARRAAPIASASAELNQCGLLKHQDKVALCVDTAAFFVTHLEAERISQEFSMPVEVSDAAS